MGSERAFFLGVDSSTTATKALLMDDKGFVVAVASSEYSYQTPQPLWSEQDPELWWRGAVASIRQVLEETGAPGEAVRGIGLTGQMHGLVLLDGPGRVLRPAILWNDQRSGTQCDQIRARLGKKRLIEISGNDALTGFTAPKILWVQQNEADIWGRARHILLPKDYLRYRLTSEYGCDKAGGAGTLLFDLRARDWSEEMLEALDIPRSYLPTTYEGPEISATLSDTAAKETGLVSGIPVMGGGGDQAAAAVGTGAVQAGVVSLSLGTSGVVFATNDSPVIEPNGRLHAFCHAVPGKWHFMGVMLSAAGSLRWHRDTFAAGEDFETLTAPAVEIPAGSDGLLFLPYLTGERTPHPDPLARAAFVGLTVRHNLAHLTRAVLEGVAYGLRDNFELMKGAGLSEITQVRVTGGGAKSALWRQILADVLGAELATVNAVEGAAFGAALLAAVGVGAFTSVQAACQAAIEVTGRTAPGPDQDVYQKMYALFDGLYPVLRTTFNRLS
jgi:xylulokinase